MRKNFQGQRPNTLPKPLTKKQTRVLWAVMFDALTYSPNNEVQYLGSEEVTAACHRLFQRKLINRMWSHRGPTRYGITDKGRTFL